MVVELKPHQQKAVDELANGKILCGGTGVGKTHTALAYFVSKVCGGTYTDAASMRTPRDVYVITVAKKRNSGDWQEVASHFKIFEDAENHPHGVKITVDSWNNIEKYEDVRDAFFIFDEQRVVGSGAWVKSFQKLTKANEWILLSATPGDTWIDYIPVFVANGFYKNRTEFKDEHVVYRMVANKFPKVHKYNGVGRLVRLRNQVLVHMPYERHTVRHIKNIRVDHDGELLKKVKEKRWHVFEERPLRDVAELFIVARKLVNSHPSRLDAVKELSAKHPRLIVFYNHDPELDVLRTLKNDFVVMSTGTQIAEYNGHKHQDIPDSERWIYLVQYQAGSEAWNCTTTDAVCFYTLTYSYRNFMQCQGRIDRMNTPFVDLWYYLLVSSTFVDKGILRALREKRSFNLTDMSEIVPNF
jgi:hypothetical protein